MGKRGGRTSGTITRGSSWRNGKTTVIRVPVNLVPEIIKFAKYLDNGIYLESFIYQEFLQLKARQYRRSGKRLIRNTPRWSVFNEFENYLKNYSK
ncbi:hypothetical protein NIES267_55020 [Calothrix parasitica NIES-267]|uniref:Uncharacterized protein n=1 Tax=Calothrix parasitica NIES-267 TaxID=1973488 RepID=A0A1Z4LXK9_9CYAN|nr:hypothetical protein NIES267_55020 [Calothrix parasitica NIES-267]